MNKEQNKNNKIGTLNGGLALSRSLILSGNTILKALGSKMSSASSIELRALRNLNLQKKKKKERKKKKETNGF